MAECRATPHFVVLFFHVCTTVHPEKQTGNIDCKDSIVDM